MTRGNWTLLVVAVCCAAAWAGAGPVARYRGGEPGPKGDTGTSGAAIPGEAPIYNDGGVMAMTPASASTSGYLPLVGGVLVVDAGMSVGALKVGPLVAPGSTGVTAGASWWLGSLNGTYAGLWVAAPVASNYVFASAGNDTIVNSSSAVSMRIAGSIKFSCVGVGCTVAAGVPLDSAVASGSVALQTLTGAKTCLGTSGVGCLTYDTGALLRSSVGYAVAAASYFDTVRLGGTATLADYVGGIGAASSLAGVTASNPAVTISPRAAVETGDLILKISRSDGTNGLWVSTDGDLIAANTLRFPGTAATVPVACTSPTITHGTATSFQADVGTPCAGITTFAFTLPTATNGWYCTGRNKTAGITRQLVQSAESTTSATMTNVDWAGAATAFTNGDDLVINCIGR
ncbi:MAG: hypothetical protein RLZZ403_1877 [Pseudomonadota bacterium]|jgi:hypothetical protein